MGARLDNIDTPADLKRLPLADLPPLAEDIRQLILTTVSKTGGHLAANLGVVELTLALLRVFDPPRDKIIWDVGHQTYAYKILTGRRQQFDTLRQYGGLSGFLRREESVFDAFGAGHSGTALSAALGFAVARDRLGGTEHVIAVVGDGSLGCGLSFEALNNVAVNTRRFIVVLNDNKMSIAANVGSFSKYLIRLLTNPRYNRWKRSVEDAVRRRVKGLNWLRRLYLRTAEAIKSLFLRNVIFEELGLRYIGPVDGHDLPTLLSVLEIARDSQEPIIIHVNTQKGRGYAFAEEAPDVWHGTGAFDVESGASKAASGLPTYSEVAGRTIERLAQTDRRIVAITAAMADGTGLRDFGRRFPERFFDVGIAEEHAVVFAAGLAAQGLRPIFAVYSTFAQRAIDCIIHDVALQKLPVIICLDRAGIVGDDGPTHHGIFDIALARSIPNLILAQPKDEAELAALLQSAVTWSLPTIIRYPRGRGPGQPVPVGLADVPLGCAEVIREGQGVHVWALGDMVPLALRTATLLDRQGIAAGVVNARFVRPLDTALLLSQAPQTRLFLTLENGIANGGFGSAVEEALSAAGYGGRVLRCGWPDQFVPHGASDILLAQCRLTPEALAEDVLRSLNGVARH
jgi:1-deoxy-D-xylulose-5-phosphate synthase